jgi:hypothetical protein
VILYDSDQQEITALVFMGEELYAAATSANAVGAEAKFAAQAPQAGRPEQKEDEEEGDGDEDSGEESDGGSTSSTQDETSDCKYKESAANSRRSIKCLFPAAETCQGKFYL